MKKFVFCVAIMFLGLCTFGQAFVSPIGFVETDANKAAVLAFIRQQVKDDCTKIGMDDPSTLRIMEKQNLDAFKELIHVTNVALLQKEIKTCCDIGMCNYYTISIMYNKENKDSQKTTEW